MIWRAASIPNTLNASLISLLIVRELSIYSNANTSNKLVPTVSKTQISFCTYLPSSNLTEF